MCWSRVLVDKVDECELVSRIPRTLWRRKETKLLFIPKQCIHFVQEINVLHTVNAARGVGC